jgi:hypothetical protein
MSAEGQIWADRGSVVTLHCYFGGSDHTYNLNTVTYTGNPGTTDPWIVSWPGYMVVCSFYSFSGGTWNITGTTIGIAANDGQILCPSAAGAVFSGRAGKHIDELAVISGSLAICIAGGTTNNWQAIHV